jgi:long-chain acyl-CoA synthetase
VTDKTTIAELEKMVASQSKVRPYRVRRWPLTGWALILRRLVQYGFILPLARFYFRLRVMGREKFGALHKPFLLIANHTSHMDAVVLTLALPWYVRRRLAVAAAADAFEYWDSSHASLREKLLRKTMTMLAVLGLNIFPFQRFAGIKKSLEYAGHLMDKGWALMIFPEGRLSDDGTVKKFKAGVGLLVKEMNAAVVPAKILGAYEIMDHRYTWPQKKGTITVRFGDPITFSPDDSFEDIGTEAAT